MKSCHWFAIPIALMFALTLNAQQGGGMNRDMGGGMGQNAGGPVSLTAGIVQQYNGIKNNLEKAADAMPEDGYSFKPTPVERDFGGWVAHVAQAQLGSCSRIGGQTPDADTMKMLQGVASGTAASKATLVAALKKSFDACDAAYNGLTDQNAADSVPYFRGSASRISALAGNVAHDNECYGSMAVYLRLKGVTPPSSEGRGGMGGNMRGQGAMGGGMQGGR
jgi:DinB superfamily